MKKVSLVFSVYNEEQGIEFLYKELLYNIVMLE